jgi:hypothetical protein
MASTTRKTKRPAPAGRRDVRVSFLSKNPRVKPPISAAKARQLVTEIQGVMGAAQLQEGCTAESCAEVVRDVKRIAAAFDVTLTCRYTCKWFWSAGGGWQKECYFKCNDGNGLTIEGTGS